MINSPLHVWAGQRAVAFISPMCRLATYIVLANHPPYPVVVVILGLAGAGIGLADAGWNAYLGDMRSTNEVLGMLHASYGLGATVSPLIISAMLEKYHLPWWTYYYIMISVTVVNVIANTWVSISQLRKIQETRY